MHRRLLPATATVTGLILAAGLALAGPAAATSADEPLVPADSGVLAPSAPLTADGGGAPDAAEGADSPSAAEGADVQAAAVSACTGGIDYPHISGTRGVTYTINTHLDGVCRAVPSQHSIEGSLYRSRWYGWEHLTSGSTSRPGARKLSLYLNKGCNGGSWFRYRATGRFYALIGSTRWSRSFYNENPDEIKCVRSPGASD